MRRTTLGAGAPHRETLRVLVADDDRDTVQSTCQLLRLWGHEPSGAYDGLEAVTAASQCPPEVALLDLGLPKIDGSEVARQLRRRPGEGSRLLVAVTGFGGADDRARCTRAGFDMHLLKPADPRRLQGLLTRYAASRTVHDCKSNLTGDSYCLLMEHLESTVHGRLGNGVRSLRIVVRDDGVVIEGRVCTYREKQLVQHLVMESSPFPILSNEIDLQPAALIDMLRFQGNEKSTRWLAAGGLQ
jgi:CheY-like chemotaxis protein